MDGLLLFLLLLVVGIGMIIAGSIYMGKEKGDIVSVKIYRTVIIIGVIITALALIYKFVL